MNMFRWPALPLLQLVGVLLASLPGFSATEPPSAPGNEVWFAFAPKPDPFTDTSVIDLRFLNEKFAGEHGFIAVKAGQFIHSDNSEPLRFWGVNGPPHELKGAELRQWARLLAKYGVNL